MKQQKQKFLQYKFKTSIFRNCIPLVHTKIYAMILIF